MSQFPQKHLYHRGFTLIEIAVVLVVLSFLIGSFLIPLAAQREMRAQKKARDQVQDAVEALYGFVMINGRFPCPASPSEKSVQSNSNIGSTAGLEAIDGNCRCQCTFDPEDAWVQSNSNIVAGPSSGNQILCAKSDGSAPGGVTGVLPWATLGLDEEDPWARRLTYRVTLKYADIGQNNNVDTNTCRSAETVFSLSDIGDSSVFSPDITIGSVVKEDVIAVVVSHGQNRFGGYDFEGVRKNQRPSNPTSAELAESRNYDDSKNFVQDPGVVDDIIATISQPMLVYKLTQAGRKVTR